MQALPTGSSFEHFLQLSVYLTGFSRFELLGTGQAQAYFAWLEEKAGAPFQQLLQGYASAGQSAAALQQLLYQPGQAQLQPLVQSLIKLWYLGQWFDPQDSSQSEILSPESYQQGLVWNAIDAHPQAAKQQGFAAWAMPPQQGLEVEHE
ncbi:hypothetical protein [Balneatrix alpica]|uniref:Uncharacterized protein n=1 Tax=Balneatrix alpica TaxID=75684 RepID=A0ABV5ZF84_9GAMM|nr:hypothetical protein [Balneatrix alpica]